MLNFSEDFADMLARHCLFTGGSDGVVFDPFPLLSDCPAARRAARVLVGLTRDAREVEPDVYVGLDFAGGLLATHMSHWTDRPVVFLVSGPTISTASTCYPNKSGCYGGSVIRGGRAMLVAPFLKTTPCTFLNYTELIVLKSGRSSLKVTDAAFLVIEGLELARTMSGIDVHALYTMEELLNRDDESIQRKRTARLWNGK